MNASDSDMLAHASVDTAEEKGDNETQSAQKHGSAEEAL